MKKLQNDYTTPEQSKRLLELGVPEWTANLKLSKLVKDSHGQKPKDKHDWVVNRKDYTHMIVGFMKYEYLPCWSVGRLMEIEKICAVMPMMIEYAPIGKLIAYLEIRIKDYDFSKLD